MLDGPYKSQNPKQVPLLNSSTPIPSNYLKTNQQMKKSILFLITLLTLASCGGDSQSVDAVINSNDMAAVKAKRAELNKQQRELKAEIDKLNAYIDANEKKEKPALVTAEIIKDTLFKHYVEVQGNVETDQNVVLNAEY